MGAGGNKPVRHFRTDWPWRARRQLQRLVKALRRNIHALNYVTFNLPMSLYVFDNEVLPGVVSASRRDSVIDVGCVPCFDANRINWMSCAVGSCKIGFRGCNDLPYVFSGDAVNATIQKWSRWRWRRFCAGGQKARGRYDDARAAHKV